MSRPSARRVARLAEGRAHSAGFSAGANRTPAGSLLVGVSLAVACALLAAAPAVAQVNQSGTFEIAGPDKAHGTETFHWKRAEETGAVVGSAVLEGRSDGWKFGKVRLNGYVEQTPEGTLRRYKRWSLRNHRRVGLMVFDYRGTIKVRRDRPDGSSKVETVEGATAKDVVLDRPLFFLYVAAAARCLGGSDGTWHVIDASTGTRLVAHCALRGAETWQIGARATGKGHEDAGDGPPKVEAKRYHLEAGPLSAELVVSSQGRLLTVERGSWRAVLTGARRVTTESPAPDDGAPKHPPASNPPKPEERKSSPLEDEP